MPEYKHPDQDFFIKQGVTPPTVEPHGTDEDIRDKLKPLKVTRWRQEGNKLIGETEMGDVVNFLPTNKILIGTDKNNQPIFKTIG